MRLLTAALALAFATAAGVASAQALDPRDGWELYRRLAPGETAKCADRDCFPRDGGMYETTTKGSFSSNTAIPGANDARLYFTIVGCGPDKRACKSLVITYNYNDIFEAPAPTVTRWNAANPGCKVTNGQDLFGPATTIPLTATTKLADIEAARRAVQACGPKFQATL